MSDITLYEVGGCIRDGLLGLDSKDIDYAVEAASYEAMRAYLIQWGFEIFEERPAYFTIRAHFPLNYDADVFPTYRDTTRLTADFVLCRKEGAYTDGRRPDDVQPGTIYDDLARRDFTVNAMARAHDGTLLDPYDGQGDLKTGVLRCVGKPMDRLTEDALRALRAIRFSVTKGMWMDLELHRALMHPDLFPLLADVATDRKRDELAKAFKKDTLETLRILHGLPAGFRHAVFTKDLWLEPTMKVRARRG